MNQIDNKTTQYLNCKAYTGISGCTQGFFNRALKIVDKDSGHKFYFNKKELLAHFCDAAHIAMTSKNKDKLMTAMVEVLNPIKGKELTLDKVNKIYKEISESFNQQHATGLDLLQKFEELKKRHLTILTYNSTDLLKNLKPGDIFFKKNPENSDNIVVIGQKLFTPVLLSKLVEREGYKYSHAALYMGDGIVAEAVTAQDGGVQLRSVMLEDSRFALDHEHGYNYVVSRSEDEELANEAVRIAKKIVKAAEPEDVKQKNSNKHKYSFVNAVRSIYHSSHFGFFAKRRYFQQYIDHKQDRSPLDFLSPKDFYCSNFVSYCYQTAESLKVAPKLIGEHSHPTNLGTGFGNALSRFFWACINRWQHIRDLDKHVKMKFDAQWVTPQDLRNFVLSNPKLFNDKFYIQPEGTERT